MGHLEVPVQLAVSQVSTGAIDAELSLSISKTLHDQLPCKLKMGGGPEGDISIPKD